MKLSKNASLLLAGMMALGLLISGGLASCGRGPNDLEIKSKVVKLISEHGSCTGEQVRAPSGTDYILSAGHCMILVKDGSVTVIKEDGTMLQRRVLAEDPNSDLMLIEGLPSVEGLPIADEVSRAEHLRSFTHGGGMPTYKTEGEVIGFEVIQAPTSAIASQEQEALCASMPKNIVFSTPTGMTCILSVKELATTVPIIPGSSGGPVVNDNGELAGVVSAGGGTLGFMVTLDDIHEFIAGY